MRFALRCVAFRPSVRPSVRPCLWTRECPPFIHRPPFSSCVVPCRKDPKMLLDNPGADLRWKRIVEDSGACV